MKPLVAVLLFVSLAVSAHAQERMPLSLSIGVNAAGTVADLYTTHQALGRGAQEAFGAEAGGGMPRIIALRVGAAAVFTYLQLYLDTHGHQKAARWVGFGAGGAGFAAAWHNTQVMR
jgi:hypothetical protein